MKKLQQAMLIGDGLSHVNTELMVSRYNECLEAMGFEPTGLTSFRIDGLGWSPEVAEEKEDRFYMTHGEANQFAIILGPEQYNKPVYHAYYSFSRDLMNTLFQRYHPQIIQVTKDTAIWLDIDQDLTSYESPYDLLMIDSFMVRVETLNGISKEAEYQRDLAHRFLQTPEAWFDPELRERIINSAASYGDLRYKNVILKDYRFNELRSFYTAAFGGMYVLRDLFDDRDYLLVFLDEMQSHTFGASDPNVFYINDPNLMALLYKKKILQDDLKYYLNDTDVLSFKKECMLVDAVSKEHIDISYSELSTAKKKKYAQAFKNQLPDAFVELERVIRHLRRGTVLPNKSLSPELSTMLLYPNPKLPGTVRHIIRHLICEITPLDVLSLYIYHKDKFYEMYLDWTDTKQHWAIEMIQSKYQSRMNV